MRIIMVRSVIVLLGAALAGGAPAGAQVYGCAVGFSFPTPALLRDKNLTETTADLWLAVSPSIITLTSNQSVQVRCRASGGNLTGMNTLPLRGVNLGAGLFATEAGVPQDQRSIFDPRVIYDNYSNRFWLVASENGGPGHTFEAGRIHIAVSKTAAPVSWAPSQWIKCTYGVDASGTPADRQPIDVQQLDAAAGASFPDRCTIAVDKDFLYICFREGRDVGNLTQLGAMALVVRKSNVTDTCPNPPCGPVPVEALLRFDIGLALHALAVDYAVDPNAQPGAWVI